MTPEKRELLKNCMDRAVTRNEVPGCSLCLIRDGREELYLETGCANIEQNIPITRDNIYRLYSMSKPVTAAAVMTLVQDGYLDLQEPVANFFPSYAHQQFVTPEGDLRPVAPENVMTVRHLLNMTAGLSYPDIRTLAGRQTTEIFADLDKRLGTDQAMTTTEFAERIGECALLFEPGRGWNYSVCADVLGAVIEKVTGMTFGDYMREAILDPVGMVDTGFYVPENKKSRLVVPYRNKGDKEGAPLIPYTGNHLGIRNNGDPNAFESGGAGLFSTLDDYRRFTGMLMNGGTSENGKKVLRPGTVQYLTSGQLTGRQQQQFDDGMTGLAGHSYGNFNRVMVNPSQAVSLGSAGEYGWDGWLGVYFSNDPAHRQTMLLMLNRTDYGTQRLTRQLRNIVYSDLV